MAINPCLLAAFLCFSMSKRALGFTKQWIRPKSEYVMPQLSFHMKCRYQQRHRILARIQPDERCRCRTRSTSASTCFASHSLEKVFYVNFHNEILSKLSPDINPRFLFLLGVSGGSDSVALFHLMRQQTEIHSNLQLHAVHFDHQQRGINSDMDRELVVNLCASHNIPLTCYFWNSDRQTGGSESPSFSQAAARSWRQSRMCELLTHLLQKDTVDGNKIGLILTAHHQDDSNETFWLKFLRGTHITHLRGMPSVSSIPTSSPNEDSKKHSRNYITARPLLQATKKQILDYLLSNGFTWREDESNQSSKYLRNRVRNELLPLVEDLVGGPNVLQHRLNRLSKQSKEIDEYLTGCARDYIREHCTDRYSGKFVLPNSSATLNLVHKQALVLWVTEQSMNECRLDYDDVERVCAQLATHPNNLQWTINIGGNWDILRLGGVLHLKKTAENQERWVKPLVKPLAWRRVDQVVPMAPEPDSVSKSVKVATTQELLSKDTEFVLSSIKQNAKLMFTAPWRQGHRPIPVMEFLRGQGIALDERQDAPVILLKGTKEDTVVAVRVTSKNLWIRNAAFDIPANEEQRDIVEILME